MQSRQLTQNEFLICRQHCAVVTSKSKVACNAIGEPRLITSKNQEFIVAPRVMTACVAALKKWWSEK